MSLLMDSRNKNDSSKTEALRTQEQHLLTAKTEREEYQRKCKESSDAIQLKNNAPITHSFDFAQMVQYPSNPDQQVQYSLKFPERFRYLVSLTNERSPK